MQRKKNKALEELKVLNNIVSPVTKKVDVKIKRKQVVRKRKRSTEQILKDRNQDEKRYKSRSKSIRRINDGSNNRWIGWRESSEEVAPITTYNLYSEDKES